MRNDEVDRLKIELFKPKNNNDEEKFFEFVKVLDASRNVKITDYLNEWKKYFE
jgi:hypothetical protein